MLNSLWVIGTRNVKTEHVFVPIIIYQCIYIIYNIHNRYTYIIYIHILFIYLYICVCVCVRVCVCKTTSEEFVDSLNKYTGLDWKNFLAFFVC